MKTIEITTQEELDNLPLDTNGNVDIIGGTKKSPINITKRYPNAYIRLKKYSVVNLYDDAIVFSMWDNSTVLNMNDNSTVKLMWGKSTVQNMQDNSTVKQMRNNSTVQNMRDNATVEEMWDNSTIKNMHDNATVKDMWRCSTIQNMRDNTRVNYMCDNSIVQNMNNNTTVKEMWDHSTIQNMQDNAIVTVYSSDVNITANGDNTVNVSKHIVLIPGIKVNKTSKIVKINTFYFNPTPELFVQYYNIPVNDGKVLLYKAVHKNNDGVYYSEYNNEFTYKIGETITSDCDTDVNETCSFGLHVGTLEFSKEFGKDWDDGVIIECEVELSELVVPKWCDGNVRTSELKVIRELK